ncbi:hypothetical protein ACFY3U_11130 [Micromonospora sp. NPDC000089]|uniref:hypothetical protein n=1 Tax=unclassified Micromonospora TaxID=2617518 RepID=UPI0036799BBF
MHTALYQFLTEIPTAAAIWSFLLVIALTVLTVLVARPERDSSPEAAVPPGPPGGAAAEAADQRRYAEEVAVAAAGAAQTARRRRDAWLAAQEDADSAWAAYDEAETAARRFAGTLALPTPRTPRTPAEYAARERWLHRVAVAAHWRGELTLPQLRDVVAHRDGWDARRHPVEQEALLARSVRDGRLGAYRAAAERERAAWRDAELAADSARALAAEATVAALRLRPALVAARRPAAAPVAATRAARFRPARVG